MYIFKLGQVNIVVFHLTHLPQHSEYLLVSLPLWLLPEQMSSFLCKQHWLLSVRMDADDEQGSVCGETGRLSE